MARRLSIRPSREPAMTVRRGAIRSEKLVYVICTATPRKYPHRRSRIIYVGTTGNGVHRVAASIANKAIEFLLHRGVRQLDVHLVTCPRRPGVRSWVCLERDLLIAFKLTYGQIPLGNKSGKNYGPEALSEQFQYRQLLKTLAKFE